jgi:SAM-dependent methyltransferase
MVEEITKCVLCNSEVSFSRLEKNKKYGIYSCSHCGMQFHNCIDHYDYNTYNMVRVKNTKMMSLRNEQYLIDTKHLLSIIDRGNILDVGCSDGLFIKTINDYTNGRCSFTGIDVDKYAIETANATKKSNMNFFNSDLINFDTIEKFDVILFRGTLQYLNNTLQQTFVKIKKIINLNGKIIIYSCPNFHSFLYYLLKENWKFFLPETKLMFNEKAIDSLAKQYNFDIEELSYPYIGTPYENREKDYKEVKEIINNENNTLNPSFWGNIMQIVMVNNKG